MPTACRPGGKKKEVVSTTANHESGPPKETEKRSRDEDDVDTNRVKKMIRRTNLRRKDQGLPWEDAEVSRLKKLIRSALHHCLFGQSSPESKVVEIHWTEFMAFIDSFKGKYVRCSKLPVLGSGRYVIAPCSSDLGGLKIKWNANFNSAQAKYRRTQDFEECTIHRIPLLSRGDNGSAVSIATVWVLGLLVMMEVESLPLKSEEDEDDDDEGDIILKFVEAKKLINGKTSAPAGQCCDNSSSEVFMKIVNQSSTGLRDKSYMAMKDLNRNRFLKEHPEFVGFYYQVYLHQLATLLLGLEEKESVKHFRRMVGKFTEKFIDQSSRSESGVDLGSLNNPSYRNNNCRNLNRNSEGCSTLAMLMLCSQLSAPLAQANVQRGRIQEGNNQNDFVTLAEESDNKDKEEGEKKQSTVASQKQKKYVSKQLSETTNDTGGDGPDDLIGTNKDNQNVGLEESLGRVANLKEGNEQGKSDAILQKRVSKVGNLEDDKEQDASDFVLMQGDEGVICDVMEDSDAWGGDDQNECDFGGEDGGEVQAAKDADDANFDLMTRKSEAEKADLNSQVQASSKELEELKNQMEINAAQNEAAMQKMINDFDAERSDFESKLNQQQSKIEGLCDELKGQKIELKEKGETIADLQRMEQISVNELKEASTRLGEANTRNSSLKKQLDAMKHELMHKEDTLAKEGAERKLLQSLIDTTKQEYAGQIQDIKFQLKTKSDAMKTLKSDLTEVNARKAEVESELEIKTAALQEMTEKASDAERSAKAVGERLAQAHRSLEAKNTELSQLSAKLEDIKNTYENALAKKEEERKRLQSSIDAAKRTHAAQIQERNSQLKTKSDAIDLLNSDLTEVNASKAEIQSQLQMKTAELEEMTTNASDAEERVKSTEARLSQAHILLQANNNEVTQLNAQLEGMRDLHEDALAKKEEEKREVESELQLMTAELQEMKLRIEELEQSTTKSPKRVQQSRRIKSSLETLDVEEPWRNSNRGSSILCDEEDTHLAKMIENEIVYNGEKVKFDDIAGLEVEKEVIKFMAIYPFQRPELFRQQKKRSGPKGLLLFGPPGTGKTMIGKAIAHESKATFFSISASSLASKWQGESEKLVKYLFTVASSSAPSVVFVDEIDSLLSQRKMNEDETSRKVKTEFLAQLDGVDSTSSGILFIGATNLPQDLDDAARRRFVKRLYIPLQDKHGREVLLRNALRGNSHSLTDSEFEKLASETKGFSGADLQILCDDVFNVRLESLLGVEEDIMSINVNKLPPISYEHFRQSLSGMNPSVCHDDLQVYLDWNNTYGSKVGMYAQG